MFCVAFLQSFYVINFSMIKGDPSPLWLRKHSFGNKGSER